MGYGALHVDLPVACEPPNFLARENTEAGRVACDICVERNFGAGQQTDRDVWVADGSEAALRMCGERVCPSAMR